MDEFDERAFLFGVEACPNSELLGGVARRKIDNLGVVRWFELEGRLSVCCWLL